MIELGVTCQAAGQCQKHRHIVAVDEVVLGEVEGRRVSTFGNVTT